MLSSDNLPDETSSFPLQRVELV